jgi:hypothetical protein
MYVFKCVRCDIDVQKKCPIPCRDGKHRCKKCIDIIKSIKYQHTEKGRKNHYAAIARFRKTDKGRVMRNRWQKKYYWKNPEWPRLKRRAAHHGLKAEDLLELFGKEPFCSLCGTDKRITLDHMHPQNRGGCSEKGNIQTLCLSCNVWKSDNLFLADGSGYLVRESYVG